MNIKRSIVALAITGGSAAVLFGGAAVHTAWSSSDYGSLSATAASVGSGLTGGDIALHNALPGDTTSSTIVFTNQGSTNANPVVAFGAVNPAGQTLANDVLVTDPDFGWSNVPLTSLAGQSFPLQTAGPNASEQTTVTLTLSNTANPADEAESVTLPYTVTATASH